MKKLLLATTALVLGACSTLPVPNVPAPGADVTTSKSADASTSVAANSVSVDSAHKCDIDMHWGYVKPDATVPAKAQALLGLWTGAVKFDGSGAELCVAMAVQNVTVGGQTDTIFVWNLGDNPESPNVHSIGQANWWAQTAIVHPQLGEQLVFAANKPYRGMWYRYILNFPTAEKPDVITGHLIATMNGSATDSSTAAWYDERQTWKVKLHRNKDSYLPFPVAPLQ